jgi:hypothetical protein
MGRIGKSEGISALYRGFSSSLVRAVVSGGGRQTVYWMLKAGLLKEGDSSLTKRMVLGSVAGVIAAGFAAPIDMVRTRQQAFKGSNRLSMWSVLASAYGEGGVSGLFVGSSAVFARQALLTGSQLAFYDRSKAIVQSVTGLPVGGFAVEGLSACVAGAAATVAIAPVEAIKTQMQAAGKGKTFRQTASEILSSSGLRGFWRGSFALWLKLAPHTLIVLVATDRLRDLFGVPMLL